MYIRSHILEYVKYNKLINNTNEITTFYVNNDYRTDKTAAIKQKSKHKILELNMGPLALQSGVLPLGNRDK